MCVQHVVETRQTNKISYIQHENKTTVRRGWIECLMLYQTCCNILNGHQTRWPSDEMSVDPTCWIVQHLWFGWAFMHQSIPTVPILPRGICLRCQSRRWGICNCITDRGLGIWETPGHLTFGFSRKQEEGR